MTRLNNVVFFIAFNFLTFNVQAKTVKWVLAHEPARVFEKAAQEFAKKVEAKTKGEIKIEIIKSKENGQPYSVAEAFALVQKGELQMSQTYTTFLGNYDQQLWILDLPFLFKNHDHAAKVLDGEIGQKLLEGLSSASIKGLAFTYSGGYRVIPTLTKPLDTMESLKNQKIGVAKDSPVAQAYLSALGARPIPVADTISSQGMKTDGFETTYARFGGIKNPKARYLNETEHTLFLTALIMNENFFKELTTEQKNIFKEVALEVAQIERNESIKDNLNTRDEFVSKQGLKLIKMSDSEKEKMKNAAKPVYEKFSKILDAALIKSIQSQGM